MADTVWDLQKSMRNSLALSKKRSDSLPDIRNVNGPHASDIAHPGGFRRHHVRNEGTLKVSPDVRAEVMQTLQNFYGSFISGMLSQDNDDYSELSNNDRISRLLQTPYQTPHRSAGLQIDRTERSPLIGRKEPAEKTATLYHALLALLKAFVGTGVLFLPHGFMNGGILFSPLLLLFVAILTVYAMIRLLQCRELVGGTFGHIGEVAYGIWGHRMVQISIVLMQGGFCCAYIIFVASNMRDVLAFMGYGIDIGHLIVIQTFVYIPLSWVRHISYFAISNLIADAFILYGLSYIMGSSAVRLAEGGAQPVQLFNSKDFPIFIGTAVFTFEGIGLVIPTQASLNKQRQGKFKYLLIGTITGLLIFYCIFASINYAAFGKDINPVVTTSLGSNGWSVSVQLGYSIAQLLSYPLFLFPAIKIVEDSLVFPSRASGYRWKKNAVRAIIVIVSICIAYFGQDRLDLFVSIVGAFCCVPLSFIYPPMFYLKLFPHASTFSKLCDYIVIAIGFGTFLFVTWSNIVAWMNTP